MHPSTRGLPLEWTRNDIYYRWTPRPTGTVHTVARYRAPGAAAGDGTTTGGTDWPISWCRDYQGGRSFYTGMGRTAAGYGQADLKKHLLGAIQWSAGLVRGGCKATILSNYSTERVVSAASRRSDQHRRVARRLAGHQRLGDLHRPRRLPHQCRARQDDRAGLPARDPRLRQPQRRRRLRHGPRLGPEGRQRHGQLRRHPGRRAAGLRRSWGGNEVNGKIETGLLGVAAAPDFGTTGHVYLQYFPTFNPDNPVHAGLADGDARRITKMAQARISRFTINLQTKKLDLNSEVVIFEYDPQVWILLPSRRRHGLRLRGQPLRHHRRRELVAEHERLLGQLPAPALPDGYPTQATNTHCGANNVSFNDARRTAGNTNDYNGKMLRFNPIDQLADGAKPTVGVGTTYSLPTPQSPNGPNLFNGTEGGGGKTLPEIYAMGLRNPSRMAIDPRPTSRTRRGSGRMPARPSATQGPSTYETATQLPSAGNYGWPYCMGNKQPYRDRIADGSLRTTNAAGFVTGGPAAGPTNGWYDCNNLVNDSTNNTGLVTLPHATGTGKDAGTARSNNVWYSRGNPNNGNGCPEFPREQGASNAPNYGAPRPSCART